MPLPKLETSKYITQLPSTKEEIEFRPFLVKEEKLLMIAQESEDEVQILKAMKDIIHACTFGKVNTEECTMYDIEYLFLQLRIKSVGEESIIRLKCDECGKYSEVSVDLTKIEVVFPKEEIPNTIQLSDSIGLTLKPLTLKASEKLTGSDEEIFNQAIIQVIDTIYDNESVYDKNDVSEQEMIEFIDSMSHSHLEAIQKYIENQPELKHTVEFKCKHDNHENKVELKGIASFF